MLHKLMIVYAFYFYTVCIFMLCKVIMTILQKIRKLFLLKKKKKTGMSGRILRKISFGAFYP